MGALILTFTVGCSGAPAVSPSATQAPTSAPASASPTSAPTDPPTPSPSPSPSPSPTPGAETLTFHDGALTIEVPFGALPDGVELNAIPRGPGDAPPELVEIDFRLASYSLEPDGLTFAQPLRVTRRVAVANLGLVVETLGMPIVALALRDSEANWEWLPNQSQIMDDEFLYVSADLTHTSALFEFSGNHFARAEYTPPELRNPVGSSWGLNVTMTAPITAPAPPQWQISEPFTHTGVLAREPVFFNSPNWEQLELVERQSAMPNVYQEFECARPGRFFTVVGYEYVQAPGNFFYSHLNLEPPTGVAQFGAQVECLAGSAGSPPTVTGGCLITVHTARGTFISYLRGLFAFGQEIRAVEVTIDGANDGEPVEGELTGDDIFEFIAGLRGAGEKRLEQVLVTMPDGTQHDVTQLVAGFLGGAEFDVPFPSEPTFGECPG